MLVKILIGVALALGAFVLLVATRSSSCRVARSVTISTSPARVFAEVNDFHRWLVWSPYEKLDPNMNRSFAGPVAGSGAVYMWSGDRRAGEGRVTIVESRPSELIRMRLEMVRPFACTNEVEFTFRPINGATEVTWAMTGQANFVTKAMGIVFSMDKMVGSQFESGLAQLKNIAEAGSPAASAVATTR